MSTTSATKRFVFGDFGHLCAFGFGLGLTPKIPGTAGTLLAFPLYWLTSQSFMLVYILISTLMFLIGIWLCQRTGTALNKHDDSGIVWDEITAFYIVLLTTPDDWYWQLIAFVLFRFFDAAKPPPINWLDKNIGGGLGVMVDDIAASLLTIFIICLLLWII